MLTRRGSWFLLIAVCVVASSLWTQTASVSLLGFTLLLWFLASWLIFQLKTLLLHGKLRITREVVSEQGPVQSLWAGRGFEVCVRLHNDSRVPLPYLRVEERVPVGLKLLDGAPHTEGPFSKDESLELRYRIHCEAPGGVRFEGLTVQMADVQGFFYCRVFVQNVQFYRILPALAEVRGRFPSEKRHNLLPLIGSHRHRRPGSGSELLNLRDYLPGDPPKRIAWKASARRDRLMTKEFESEVPIRCTLFVDTSHSVRIGLPGQNALARLIEIAAATFQANTEARDLTGLCLFDERGTTSIRPARGPAHFGQVYALLADAAAQMPATGAMAVRSLLPLAYGLAEEVYPQLLERDVNRFPWWLPLWAPQPADTARRPDFPPGTPWRRWKQFGRWCADAFRQQIIARMSVAIWKRYRWRKQVAAILTARSRMGPGLLALLLEDDERLVLEMQRFLHEHHLPFHPPLYGPHGEYLFAAPDKVEILAGALRQAVGRGRDNELFVLFADLLEITHRLDPLLAAVKMAVARHHAVMLVCPWPPEVPPPNGSTREAEKREAQFKAALAELVIGNRSSEVLRLILRHTTMQRLHRAFDDVRHAFARLGVPVACAAADESVGMVLNRMERLRGLERGVR